jgi:hypothetical protein
MIDDAYPSVRRTTTRYLVLFPRINCLFLVVSFVTVSFFRSFLRLLVPVIVCVHVSLVCVYSHHKRSLAKTEDPASVTL